jgi:hypothetical protein
LPEAPCVSPFCLFLAPETMNLFTARTLHLDKTAPKTGSAGCCQDSSYQHGPRFYTQANAVPANGALTSQAEKIVDSRRTSKKKKTHSSDFAGLSATQLPRSRSRRTKQHFYYLQSHATSDDPYQPVVAVGSGEHARVCERLQ